MCKFVKMNISNDPYMSSKRVFMWGGCPRGSILVIFLPPSVWPSRGGAECLATGEGATTVGGGSNQRRGGRGQGLKSIYKSLPKFTWQILCFATSKKLCEVKKKNSSPTIWHNSLAKSGSNLHQES
jgi:hypothetical protein